MSTASEESSRSNMSMGAVLDEACDGASSPDDKLCARSPCKKLRRWRSLTRVDVEDKSAAIQEVDTEVEVLSAADVSPARSTASSQHSLADALHDACKEEEPSQSDRQSPEYISAGHSLTRVHTVPEEPLTNIFKKLFGALTPAMASTVERQCGNIELFLEDSCLSGLPLTTGCSGTDMITVVLRLFFTVATLMLGVPLIPISHLWSCESCPHKAAWISDVMGIGRVFKDVRNLASGLAALHNFLNPGTVGVGLLHAAGFNCQDVSALNRARHKFKQCIRQRKGKTGGSFWGTFTYARRYLPLFLWLEIVATLRGQNLSTILSLLRMIGYLVVTIVTNIRDHGTPCSRNRIWILCKLAPRASISEQEFAQKRASEIEEMLRQEPEDLSEFLCPEEDNVHQPLRPKPKRKAAPKKLPKRKAAPKKALRYIQKHKDIWAGQEPKESPAIFKDLKQVLTPRELDVAVYDYVVRDHEYEVGVERFLDVSQSIDRCPRENGALPTVTPGAVIVMIRREEPSEARLIRSFEKMRMQGFHTKMLTETGKAEAYKYSQKVIANLAGNAFAANHIGLAAIVSLLLFEVPSSVQELEELRNQACLSRTYVFRNVPSD